MLRADLRICRALGLRFSQWLDELDDFERSVWRALDEWERDVCPGCGQSSQRAVFEEGKPKPRYRAGFTQCCGCEELLRQQEAQRIIDTRKLNTLTAGRKNPELIARPVTGHRHWRVEPAEDAQE